MHVLSNTYYLLHVSVYAVTSILSLCPLLVVKILHLLDRTELFKISNLVYVFYCLPEYCYLFQEI
jgi:hypothetical protein